MRNAAVDPVPRLPEDDERRLIEEYQATRNVLFVAPIIKQARRACWRRLTIGAETWLRL